MDEEGVGSIYIYITFEHLTTRYNICFVADEELCGGNILLPSPSPSMLRGLA